ncbi:MAG: phytanoyl-CoA dioxygenase family protein [Phycisphaerae bacterium]
MNAQVIPADMRREFDEQGYVVCPAVLSAVELAVINRELDQHYGLTETHNPHAPKPDKFGCEVTYWNPVVEQNRAFLDLLQHPWMRQLTTACIGDGYVDGADHTLVMLSQVRGKGQAWHQDCPADNLDHFNVNRLFYTRDVALEDGAIVLVPGSQRRGRIPRGDQQEAMAGEIILTPKAGTLVFLNGLVFHRVTPNVSARPRISVNFRAYKQGVPTHLCDIGVFRNGAMDFRQKQEVDK